MIRTCDFQMEGISLKLASMSVAEAEQFVNEGNDFLERMKRGELKAEEWIERRNRAVVASLSKASPGVKYDVDWLKNELDLPTIAAAYDRILDFSGLKPGEAVAVADSSKSVAA
jgi:hypothetical protein